MDNEDKNEEVERCRILNDELRENIGKDTGENVVHLTLGLKSMSDQFIGAALDGIRTFKAFNNGNDPYAFCNNLCVADAFSSQFLCQALKTEM